MRSGHQDNSWMWQHGHGTDVEEHGASDNHLQDGGCSSSETIKTQLANCTASHHKKTTTVTGPPWTKYHLMKILWQLGVNGSERYTCYSGLTLLTRKSFSSKCRPNILGASPGMGSILMHTSCPFLALSTVLWLLSMLVTTPKSTNWKNDTIKRQKTMKSSLNDIMEPQAFTHCHWLAVWGSKTGSESIEVEWDPQHFDQYKRHCQFFRVYQSDAHLSLRQGCTNSKRLNFVRWLLTFVGPQYTACFMSSFCGLQFWSSLQSTKIFVHPCTNA